MVQRGIAESVFVQILTTRIVQFKVRFIVTNKTFLLCSITFEVWRSFHFNHLEVSELRCSSPLTLLSIIREFLQLFYKIKYIITNKTAQKNGDFRGSRQGLSELGTN